MLSRSPLDKFQDLPLCELLQVSNGELLTILNMSITRREKEKKELEHELIQNLKDRNDSLAKKVLVMMEEIKEFKNNKETIIPLKM